MPRIGREHTGGIGEHQQHLGAEHVRDEGGEPVVVAVPDLVVGDRVVLVDDRQHAQRKETTQRLPRMQVLRSVHEVEGGEQHLPDDDPALAEQRAEAFHEPGLADRGNCLQCPNVPRRAPDRRS